MGELCAGGSTAKPDHIPTLEERVDTLSNQVILLISHFRESANKSVEMAMPDDEVDGFLSPKEERERDEAEKGKARLPKFAPPQPFDGTMKEMKSFISSLILYIYMEGRQSSLVMSQRLCLRYCIFRGEKCSTGKMRPSIDCSWAGAVQRFQRFHHSVGGSIQRSEPQSHRHREIKNPMTGILFCGQIYITIQSRGFTD